MNWGVEKITTREEFQALAPQWNALLERSAANTVTLTHEWLTTWWDVFGQERELCILLVQGEGKLIGIAPLLKRRVSSFGLSVQRLEFLASGEDEADEICSDYLDFISEREREADVLAAICHYLREVESDWDEIVLKEVVSTSSTIELLSAHCESNGIKCDISPLGEAVYLPLNEDWQTVIARLPRKKRHAIRQDEKTALKHGYTVEIADDAKHFEAAFNVLVVLHQNLWTQRGFPGAFASEKFTRFHRELAAKLLPLGQLRLYLLQHENSSEKQTCAALYVFVYDGKAHYYQSGFAAGGPVRSPGTLIRNKAIQHAQESGLSEWDFLKAEPDSYKYRWSQHTRQLQQIRIAKPQAKETVLATANFVVDELRKVKRALKR